MIEESKLRKALAVSSEIKNCTTEEIESTISVSFDIKTGHLNLVVPSDSFLDKYEKDDSVELSQVALAIMSFSILLKMIYYKSGFALAAHEFIFEKLNEISDRIQNPPEVDQFISYLVDVYVKATE